MKSFNEWIKDRDPDMYNEFFFKKKKKAPVRKLSDKERAKMGQIQNGGKENMAASAANRVKQTQKNKPNNPADIHWVG